MWVGNICIIFVPKNILNLNVIKHIEPLQKCFYFLWYICLHYIFTLHNVIRNLLFPQSLMLCLQFVCIADKTLLAIYVLQKYHQLLLLQCNAHVMKQVNVKTNYIKCAHSCIHTMFLRQINCFYIHNTSNIILYLHSKIQQPVLKFILNPSTYTIHQSQFGIIIQKFNNFL